MVAARACPLKLAGPPGVQTAMVGKSAMTPAMQWLAPACGTRMRRVAIGRYERGP